MSEIDHFGLYTVVHLSPMESKVFDGNGKLIRTFGMYETAWQDANRYANDKMVKDLISA